MQNTQAKEVERKKKEYQVFWCTLRCKVEHSLTTAQVYAQNIKKIQYTGMFLIPIHK